MSSIKEALTAHLPTGGSIFQGGSHRSGIARICSCDTEIWVFHDEVPDPGHLKAIDILNQRFVEHIMEQLKPDHELLLTAARVRGGDSNDEEIEALWDVAQAYADLFDSEIPDTDPFDDEDEESES